MNTITVVGTVAIDSVESPFGKQEECFGGSAAYFSYAASYFAAVRLVGVVGRDFPPAYRDILLERGIDLTDLHEQKGSTFRWQGKYEGDMNVAKTLGTDLNVLVTFDPVISNKNTDYLFLANIDPVIQSQVLKQMNVAVATAADTMNLWIDIKKDELFDVLRQVDMLVINDAEARQLTGESNLVRAMQEIALRGPTKIVIKKGEHGALGYYNGTIVAFPAFPLEKVVDPTGAGDTFAGALLGYLAQQETFSLDIFMRAIAYGAVVASFTVEDFSLNRLRTIHANDIVDRFEEYKKVIRLK